MRHEISSITPELPSGFTLVEVAIVLFVLALLAGSILVPLSAQMEQRHYDETTRTMNDVRDALLGYVVTHRYLPCPDSDGSNDGFEDVVGSACASAQGNLPWATLGIGATDAWGRPFLYRVTPGFAQRPSVVSLTSTGSIRVCSTAACTAGTILTSDAAVLFLSRGTNQGTCSAACPDEAANYDGNSDFVSHEMGRVGAASGEYDDVVMWIAPSMIFTRMIAANLLP
jgi:prepilin-type N-terminal cleavage/methylation domain-containing protein